MTRPPMHRWFLWGAMVCALGASWAHVAQAFGQLERGGAPAWISRAGPASAVLAAVGLDLGMMGLAWAVAARRRMGKPASDLWATVAVFAALSSFANLDAALRVLLGKPATWATVAVLDPWSLARVGLLAAALPLLVLALARAVEVDAELTATVAADAPAAGQEPDAVPEPRAIRRGRRPAAGVVAQGA